jgi:hypothetical protein
MVVVAHAVHHLSIRGGTWAYPVRRERNRASEKCHKLVTIFCGGLPSITSAGSSPTTEGLPMARRLFSALADRLRLPQDDVVHFHQGAGGLPAACYDVHCRRPRLDAE